MSRRVSTVACGLAVVFCVAGPGFLVAQVPAEDAQERNPSEFGKSFTRASAPEQVGMDSARLTALTEWLTREPLPVFSLLVSRHGKLVYELYTSGIERDRAHYLMSVTKSVLSALIGQAVDRGLIPGPDTPVTKVLPRRLFGSDREAARFGELTIREVMGMTALDAPDPPRDDSPAARRRLVEFFNAPDRARYVLTLPLLPPGGAVFQYNDCTPMLAAAVLQHAAGMSALEFATQHLFTPLGFRNFEWQHQDARGLDNGGYGLRLRPIDMQKFGVLFLRRGVWNGKRLLSKAWVERSFSPWQKSRPDLARPDYGTFWWTIDFGNGWRSHSANGWKGQRIDVIPGPGLVVTMTGCFEDGTENACFSKIVTEYLQPAVRNTSGRPIPRSRRRLEQLTEALAAALTQQRIAKTVEGRMVPSVKPKETRRPTALDR